MNSTTNKPPRLDAEALEDGDTFSLAMDRVLLRDEEHRRLSKHVMKVQRKLAKHCTGKTWAIFLRVEQITNHRDGHAIEVLVRWAFLEGVRCGREGRDR